MPTYKWLKYVKCPVHIIHGTNDKLIPFSTSVKLSKIKPEITRLWPIIDGGHKNLNNFESYHEILSQIINFEPAKVDLSSTSFKVAHSAKRTT